MSTANLPSDTCRPVCTISWMFYGLLLRDSPGRSTLSAQSIPQFLPRRHAVPPHGDLRQSQDESDLPGAHRLQISQDKNDPLLPAEPVEGPQGLADEIGRLQTCVGRYSRVAQPVLRCLTHVAHGHRLPGAGRLHVIVHRIDRDPVEPAIERLAGAEAADVAEDLQEGFLADVES